MPIFGQIWLFFGQKILMIREAAIILVASYQGLDTSFVLKILTGDAPMQWAARDECAIWKCSTGPKNETKIKYLFWTLLNA